MTNNKHKASVFTLLFSDEASIKELYEALSGVKLSSDSVIEINTLDEAIYMDRINDISFVVDNRLVVLIEHQSTINPNMPLRLLMYVARLYEKMLGDESIYKTRQIMLPRPEFYLFYNGEKPYKNQTLQLSDSFIPFRDNAIHLDLSVKIISANDSSSKKIIQHSTLLMQYNAFVNKIQEYKNEGLDKEEAMKKAVFYCHNHDILQEFLQKHASEVMNMLITEWDWDKALKIRGEEGREEGIEEGREETARNLLTLGCDIEMIAKATNLSVEVINKLKNKE
jgi:predicted transposase/invertase (TIGR01784 family)